MPYSSVTIGIVLGRFLYNYHMSMQLNGIFKKIVWVLITLILGALWSGLWESLFKSIFQSSGLWIINFMSSVFSNYKDMIYTQASDGFTAYPSIYVLLVIIVLVTILYQKHLVKHPQVKERKTKYGTFVADFINSRNGYLITCFAGVFAIAFLYVSAVQFSYINQIITYSEKSINIVSPYITEKDRLILQSQFSSISKAYDFYSFQSHLQEIAMKNNLILPVLKL